MCATLLETIKGYAGQPLQTEDGDSYTFTLLGGLTPTEIEAFENKLNLTYPPELREALIYTRGFDQCPIESVDLSGTDVIQEYEGLFSRSLNIAHDGFGNYWVLDLTDPACPEGRVYYVAHDPPVVVFQTDSLAHFVDEILKLGHPPFTSEVDTVHEAASRRIWRENPDILSWEQCQASSDKPLKAFSDRLDETWLFCDLRTVETGMGFSWGRFGPNTPLARMDAYPIFAYQRRESWFKRFFKR